jgi:hypothetical protein
MIASIVAGWFYGYLFARYGKVTAFNREPASSFSLSNHPISFYTEIRRQKVFIDPVRPGFQDTLLPLLYSDLWGDYWMFFLVYGLDSVNDEILWGLRLKEALSDPTVAERIQTNRHQMGSYLGRVNLVSLLPTAIMLLGVGMGLFGLYKYIRSDSGSNELAGLSLFSLIVICSILGYLWFLILYPNPDKGDTIKGTYLLHIFPLIAILTGHMLTQFYHRNKVLTGVLIGLLILVGVHNFRAMITQYWMA